MRLAILALIGLLGPCLGLGAEGDEPPPLRFRLTAEPATLDWTMARSSHETYIIMNIMEGLVEERSSSRPVPALAKGWNVSSDGKTYVFEIQPGVKWSDGKELVASDFVNSWLRLLDAKTGSSYASFLFDIENAEAFHFGKIKKRGQVGVKALARHRLQVKLRAPAPSFLHLLSFWVTFPIRDDLIRKHGPGWATPGKIATLGPYRLESWKPGASIRLSRNPRYHLASSLPKGLAPTVEALIEPDDQRARKLFEDGKLDFMLDATTSDLLKAKAAAAASGPDARKLRAQQFPYLATYYLGFNFKAPSLKDVSIRRALAIAIDRESLPSVLQGGQVAASGWIPPGIEGHNPSLQLKGTLYDAKGALLKAGYPEGQGFPRLSLLIEKFDGAEALSEYLMKALRERIGVEIASRVATSPSEFQAEIKSGKADLFVGHWGADYPDASNFLEVFASGSGTNYTGWSDPKYDDLLARSRASLQNKDRLSLNEAAENLLALQELAIVPLFYRKNTVLLWDRVLQLEISPLNYLFLKTVVIKQ